MGNIKITPRGPKEDTKKVAVAKLIILYVADATVQIMCNSKDLKGSARLREKMSNYFDGLEDKKWDIILKRVDLTPGKISQALYDMKRRRIIKIKEVQGGIEIVLTEKGKKNKQKIDLDNLKIAVPKDWDSKWRLLMFDIPEKKRLLRDQFRRKLNQIGLLRFQQSVWIYPYECEKELMFLAEVLNIAEYLTILTATIEDDKLLRKYFKLK